MAYHNRPAAASSSTSSSGRVRQLWRNFEKTLASGRTVMDHKVQATKAKADSEYNKTPVHLRMSSSQHGDLKEQLVKKMRELYFEGVRAQWHSTLAKAGLRAEDWTDITPQEMGTVASLLGDDIEDESDEDVVVVGPTPSAPVPQPSFSIPFLQPVAPSISTSSRSSNISTASSYALVNPSEFHSEEEDDYFFNPVTVTSHDLTSDDDDDSTGLPIPIHRGNPFGGWNSDSLGSSLQNSVDSSSGIPFSRPLVSKLQNNSNGRPPMGKSSASAQSEKEKDKASGGKTKIRQSYIGPHLNDPDEPLSEADDFELFKMKTRMQKIAEFHQAAALAEIHLSIEIYKDRKGPNGETQGVSDMVIEHQKQMSQLQVRKEEERKAIVKGERTKRRSEMRSRPGRSNTLIAAPIPSVPTNPSWLTDFQSSVPHEVESHFDLSKILSDDPSEHQTNIEQFLQQMFPDTSSPQPVSHRFSEPNQFEQIPAHERLSSQSNSASATRWGMVSSASMQSSASESSSHGGRPQPQVARRRPSDAAKRHKTRPSLFGDESSDEDECNHSSSSPAEEEVNPFGHADVNAFLSSHLQEDPEIAAAFAQYSGRANEYKPSPSSPPPMQFWATRQPTMTQVERQPQHQQNSAPPAPQSLWASKEVRATPIEQQQNSAPTGAQSLWASKEVRATPIVSGWTRKKSVVSATPQPQPQPATSYNNPFGMSEQDGFLSSNTAALASTVKGKNPLVSPMMERQPIWEEPPKKVSPPAIPPPVATSNKPSAFAPTPSVTASKAEVKVEKATPAPPPPPAPAGKKQNKKQRQQGKKGGPPGAANAEAADPEPTGPQEEQPAEPIPSPTLEPPQNPEPVSLMARMIPGMARVRRDSTVTAGWDDNQVGTTPRPAAKIPAHLLHESMTPKTEGTPRPNLLKKAHIPEGITASSRLSVDQLGQASTIKGPQWGAASNSSGNRSVWNIFGSDPSSAPPKTAAQQAQSGGNRIPGGFDMNGDGDDGGGSEENDGGGGDDEDAPATQQFWKAQPASLWGSQAQSEKITSPPVQQVQPPPMSAAQRLRRMSEAAPNTPAVRTPVTKAAPAVAQSQPIPPPSNVKKGKAKKNGKGKKVTVEEVEDEEDGSRGGTLPVDSRAIMMPVEAKVILEPKPSVASRMFDSIISYGDEDEDDDATSSSFAATPSTAPSSPPDIFGGDEARIAAAIKELQEGTLKMQKVFGGAGAPAGAGGWGSANANAKHTPWTPSVSDVEPQSSPIFSPFGYRPATAAAKPPTQQTPIWGQLSSKDKGKGKMTDVEESIKATNPAIQNLKRSKPAAGGKLF